jgi:hypothetical protein
MESVAQHQPSVGAPAPGRTAWRSRLAARWRAWLQALREIVYGMTSYEFVMHARHLRAERETLLLLLTFGDMLGLPVLPPYYALRLLPYVVPELEAWKRRVLRERHPLENEEYDLIEM